MDVKITKLNGESFTLSEYEINALDFVVDSIPIDSRYGKVESRSGTVDYGATYGGQRPIRVPFSFEAGGHDFALKRDEIFDLILDLESFYIEEMRMLSDANKLIGGKRYLVRIANRFMLEQYWRLGKGEFIFETTDLPFAESVHTTKDIDDYGIETHFEQWAFGMGIPLGEDLKYTHEGNSFRIFNAGNVPVHPFEQDLKITISNVHGSDEYFELRNVTNNTVFRVTEPVSDTQNIVLDGPSVTSNSLAFLRSTNKQFIELVPGWNEFEITGASSAKISFDFRFYYK